MNQDCVVHNLGLVPYEVAWQLQNELAVEIGDGIRAPTLLLLEHPHTFTFGRRGNIGNLLWDEAELARRNVSVHWVDRGGDITYHGPGQLVGYPLLPLGNSHLVEREDVSSLPQADYIGYIRKLELSLISALAKLGVSSHQQEGFTGVWVSNHSQAVPGQNSSQEPKEERVSAKIAAIGVKVDARGVTRHGFALNVNPDMAYWNGIIGCGLVDYPVTCLADLLDPPPTMKMISEALIASFGNVYQYKMTVELLESLHTRIDVFG